MQSFGGVPSNDQINNYLNAISASSNQKSLVAAALRSGPAPHAVPIGKIKDILAGNS